MVLPALTAVPDRPEWRDTARRHTSFIIKCPNRLRSDFGDTLVLWGIKTEITDKTLLIDASRLGQRRNTATVIGTEDLPALALALQTWTNGRVPTLKAPLACQAVTTEELDNAEEGFFARISSTPPVHSQIGEALQMARRLQELLDTQLRPYTAEHHRRAMRTLIQRLQDQTGETGSVA